MKAGGFCIGHSACIWSFYLLIFHVFAIPSTVASVPQARDPLFYPLERTKLQTHWVVKQSPKGVEWRLRHGDLNIFDLDFLIIVISFDFTQFWKYMVLLVPVPYEYSSVKMGMILNFPWSPFFRYARSVVTYVFIFHIQKVSKILLFSFSYSPCLCGFIT